MIYNNKIYFYYFYFYCSAFVHSNIFKRALKKYCSGAVLGRCAKKLDNSKPDFRTPETRAFFFVGRRAPSKRRFFAWII